MMSLVIKAVTQFQKDYFMKFVIIPVGASLIMKINYNIILSVSRKDAFSLFSFSKRTYTHTKKSPSLVQFILT